MVAIIDFEIHFQNTIVAKTCQGINEEGMMNHNNGERSPRPEISTRAED